MTLEEKIKVALLSYKEGLISREEAVAMITAGLQKHCENCSHQGYSGDLKAALATIKRAVEDQLKEDLQWSYAVNATGVECTE